MRNTIQGKNETWNAQVQCEKCALWEKAVKKGHREKSSVSYRTKVKVQNGKNVT